MANLQEIKSRISGIRDTQKITNAMYLISSTKLRRARAEWERTQPFFAALKGEIGRLFVTDHQLHSDCILPPDAPEPEGCWGCLVVTADRGLAGAYNLNVLKEARRLLERHPETRLYVLGEYGLHAFHTQGIPVEPAAVRLSGSPRIQDARELGAQLMDAFQSGQISQLYLIYTHLRNGLMEEAVTERLLPFRQEEFHSASGESREEAPYLCVPDASAVLEGILPSYMTGYLYSALVDSYCCEHNARMTAMRAANDNAEEMLRDLQVQYHRVRQAIITQEITEVSSGARAQRRKHEQEGAE